jgi:hypothetical protein
MAVNYYGLPEIDRVKGASSLREAGRRKLTAIAMDLRSEHLGP